ncbi:MAG: PilZ domain-containing protein [Bryobacter sp.]|nr:PilZ domain-containing protein [Bryobacter sp.]
MERRRTQRFEVNAPITMQTAAGPVAGLVVDVSVRGLRVLLESEIGAGTPVRVSVQGSEIAGEVVYGYRFGDRWAVGISLAQSLAALQDLAMLRSAIFGAEPVAPHS